MVLAQREPDPVSLAAIIAPAASKGKEPDRCLEAASQLLAAIHAHDAQGVDMALKAHKAAVESYEKGSSDSEDDGDSY